MFGYICIKMSVELFLSARSHIHSLFIGTVDTAEHAAKVVLVSETLYVCQNARQVFLDIEREIGMKVILTVVLMILTMALITGTRCCYY